jgi:hypothetical protein
VHDDFANLVVYPQGDGGVGAVPVYFDHTEIVQQIQVAHAVAVSLAVGQPLGAAIEAARRYII